MRRFSIVLLLIVPLTAQSGPWFDGRPEYLDAESRTLAETVLAAHGGMPAMKVAQSLKFHFFTKVVGAPSPFYSVEAVDLASGDAYIDWPFWDATIAWDSRQLWSHRWPMPMPAGFFIRLTTSFITLPWQIQANGANVGPVSSGKLPNDDKLYKVLRITFDRRSPSIPGTFYEMYVDPQTKLMRGIRFDINHPGMVANPKQPLGPNVHVFGDYKKIDGMLIPMFYKSFGKGSAQGGSSNAYHFLWDVNFDQPFDTKRLLPPEGATVDSVSADWWEPKGGGKQITLPENGESK